ncbi:MAG: hypothetical protein ABJE10_00205 [bacterium]
MTVPTDALPTVGRLGGELLVDASVAVVVLSRRLRERVRLVAECLDWYAIAALNVWLPFQPDRSPTVFMGHREDRHKHAQKRRRDERSNSIASPKSKALEPRVPLAGYEALYEITRSGRIYSLKSRRFLAAGYHHSPFVRFTVNGAIVSIAKDKAVSDSWSAVDTPS